MKRGDSNVIYFESAYCSKKLNEKQVAASDSSVSLEKNRMISINAKNTMTKAEIYEKIISFCKD